MPALAMAVGANLVVAEFVVLAVVAVVVVVAVRWWRAWWSPSSRWWRWRWRWSSWSPSTGVPSSARRLEVAPGGGGGRLRS